MKKQTMYNRLQKQYEKLNQSIQKAMQTGRFYAYTQFKQQQLLSRLKRCSFQLKQLGAGVAVVAALGVATPAVGQVADLVQKTGADNPFNGLDFEDHLKPEFVDIDGDGDLDMFIGELLSSATVKFFRNTGTNISPSFVEELGTTNPLNHAIGYTFISFVDIDNDGDMDMFGGKYIASGQLDYYENTGTATAPVFVERTGIANPLDTVIQDVLVISSAIRSFPFFVDIDDDGDQDCFISSAHYFTPSYIMDVLYYENIGTASIPSFSPQSGMNNPLSIIGGTGTDAIFPALEFEDMDNDGDLDGFMTTNTFIGGNRFNYYENTGTATNPTFNLNTVTPLDSIVGVNLSGAMALVDLDDDGDLDVYVKPGDIYGALANFYENCDIKTSTSSLKSTALNTEFVIYPNPSKGILHFETPLTGELSLYNIDGKELFSQQIENNQSIELPLIKDGLYTLVIQTAKERIVEKVFIKK